MTFGDHGRAVLEQTGLVAGVVTCHRDVALGELEVDAVAALSDAFRHDRAADPHRCDRLVRALRDRLRHRVEEHDVALHQHDHPHHRADAQQGDDAVPQPHGRSLSGEHSPDDARARRTRHEVARRADRRDRVAGDHVAPVVAHDSVTIWSARTRSAIARSSSRSSSPSSSSASWNRSSTR